MLSVGIMKDKDDTNNRAIIEKLRRKIESEAFGHEGRLPPERNLAQELGISRSALRKALDNLESEGLLWRQVGKGTFVRTNPFSSPELSSNLTIQTNPVEIMEVMAILQPKIAAMAALRSSQQEIENMCRYTDRCEQADNVNIRLKWDFYIHNTIARASGNNILIAIADYLYKSKVWGRRKETVFTPDRWLIYNRQHREIIDAIQDRDPVRAFELMENHIETVKKHLLSEP
jgi:GntR family transcriptional repressor for pyruvate dehydrogenase complex